MPGPLIHLELTTRRAETKNNEQNPSFSTLGRKGYHLKDESEPSSLAMEKKALVVGVSGITGSNLAERLLAEEWTVYGLARNPQIELEGLIPISADLLNTDSLASALSDVSPTHVFITSWMRNETEAENIRVNSLMVRNLLNAVAPKKTVQHVALVTGLKHYLGPFEAYAKAGTLPITPVREEHPRLDIENFYYAQ